MKKFIIPIMLGLLAMHHDADAQTAQQQLPPTLTIPTDLVNHMALQIQSMSAYQGGVAEREAQATIVDLQKVIAPQLQQHQASAAADAGHPEPHAAPTALSEPKAPDVAKSTGKK